MLQMKYVLVTGANGFVGKPLCQRLAEQGARLRLLLRSQSQVSGDVRKIAQEFVIDDLENPQHLVEACEGIDTVFHLAGYAHAIKEHGDTGANKHHAINFVATQKLFNAAIRAGVKRFVYFSSVKAAADVKAEQCVDESWNKLPDSPYGQAKRKAEQYILNRAQESDIHVSIIRPTLVYGAGVKGNILQMIKAIDKGIFPPLPEVNNKRSMISVNDLIEAAILSAINPDANGNIYIVTDGCPYTTRQLYEAICRALNKKPSKWHVPVLILVLLALIGDIIGWLRKQRFVFDTQAFDRLTGWACYDSSRIQNELAFKPKDDFYDLIREIVMDYKTTIQKQGSQ